MPKKVIGTVLLLIVLSLISVSLTVVSEAASPDQIFASAQRMNELGLISGKNESNPDDLQLDDSMTRGELMTIMVRVLDKKITPASLKE